MENFIDICGYDGMYSVSQFGNVLSKHFNRTKTLRPGLTTSGYKFVSLHKNGIKRTLSIHRLVAITFLPNNDNLPEVNHKDGNKLNNHISNLEWCTRSQNIKHMYDSGLKTYKPMHYKGKFGIDHNRSKSVICIETSNVYGSMSEASRLLDIHVSSVCWSIKNKKPIRGMRFELIK